MKVEVRRVSHHYIPRPNGFLIHVPQMFTTQKQPYHTAINL